MNITEVKYLGTIDLPQDKAYLTIVQDILSNPEVQTMKNYLQHGQTSCLEHSLRVSYRTYCYCKKKGYDASAAARAGLLHDMFLYDWHLHRKETGNWFHGFSHPYTALKNAEKAFSLSAKEKNMILRHMWPLTVIPPHSKEGLALMWFDKVASLEETCLSLPFFKVAPEK